MNIVTTILLVIFGFALGAGTVGIVLVLKDKYEKPDGIMHIVDDTITLELKIAYLELSERDEVVLKVDYSQD